MPLLNAGDGHVLFAARRRGRLRQDRAADAVQPVLLIHGLGADHTVWGLQLRGLAARADEGLPPLDLIAPDLPGRGRSPGPPPREPAAAVARLAGLLQAQGLAPAHVVGHSLGGALALALALARPELVRSLFLLGSAPRTDAARWSGRLGRAAGRAAFLDASLGSGPGIDPALRARAARALDARDPASLEADLALASALDLRARLPALRTPLRALHGARDAVVPPGDAAPLAPEIVPDAGHMLMWERPSLVTAALAGWLVERRSSGGRTRAARGAGAASPPSARTGRRPDAFS